jgi:two-component system, NarL family, response regulator NreC
LAIRIVIADDHTVLRLGLRTLLDMQPDMQVVGEAGDGRALLAIVKELLPDVALMDIGMPNLNGIEATREALVIHPELRVLALSMFSDEQYVAGMLRAGASGYLLKSCDFEELATAVRTVMTGRVHLSPGIAGTVLEGYLSHIDNDHVEPAAILSHREREVLQLLAEGLATKAIAHRLNLGERTVETHRRQIMEKLSLHSVAELTKYAVRQGLTSLDP